MGKVGQMPIDVAIFAYYNPRSMTRKRRLRKVEEKAQELFEKSISRLLGGSNRHRELARQLVNQVEESHYQGRICDQFWIHITADEIEKIERESDTLELDLARFLVNYAGESGYSYLGPLQVTFIAGEDSTLRNPLIAPACSVARLESTKALQAVNNGALLDDLRFLDAFLIDRAKHIPLDQTTITIGRHLENDIIIDSKNVSRRHAQIRWHQGVFVIHDLGSKAGTAKNGVPVRESVLRPGDVIIIGGSSYIYGEGLTPVQPETRFGQSSSGTTQSLENIGP